MEGKTGRVIINHTHMTKIDNVLYILTLLCGAALSAGVIYNGVVHDREPSNGIIFAFIAITGTLIRYEVKREVNGA